MSELASSARETKREALRTSYDEAPAWTDAAERIDQLCIPQDAHERADDIARNITSAADLKAYTAALHQVLVPGYRTVETEFAMNISTADKSHEKILSEPDERDALYEQAAEQIAVLAASRSEDGSDDQAFLERAGNVAAIAIVVAHPYADGNGRTARVIGELFRSGPASSQLSLAAANRVTSSSGVRMNTYKPRGALTAPEVLNAAASQDVPLSDTKKYHEIVSENFQTPYSH